MMDPAEQREGLTLRQYAEVSAHLRHFAREPANDVLARLGLAEEAWAKARDAWRRAIDDDVTSGDGALVTAFAATFAETRRKLEAGEDLAAPKAAPAPTPAPSAPPPPVPAMSVESPITPPPITPPPIAPSAAGSPWARPRMPSGPVDRDFDPLNATVSVHPSRLQAPVVPFTPAPAPDPVPAPVQPAVQRPPKKLTGTADLDLGPALKRVLPFAGDAVQPTNTAAPQATKTTPPAAALPNLTLEQYASLSAEISLAPERTAVIRARYFIAGDDALRALQRSWQERFAADPALEGRYHALLAQYSAWLLQRKE